MWHGMVHEVECGMRCYTLHNMLCHITQPHTAHHCCTILWHSHITCRVMCNMCCDGARCGMWCNEQHARCGFYDMEWCMMWNMVWFKMWLNVEWNVVCHVLLWCGVMCFMVHITHHALPHLTTTYCTPCYALTCMWDVSLWYGMVHVECGVVCGMLTHCTPQPLNSTSHITHLFMLHITHHTCIIKCKHNSASQPH